MIAVSRFNAVWAAFVAMLLLAAVAAAQPEPPGDAEHEAAVAEILEHGDPVIYISPSVGFAMIVEGYEELVPLNHPDIDLAVLEVIMVSTILDMASLIAGIDPQPGDEYTMTKAECQRRTNPCKAGCYETPPVNNRRYSNRDTKVVSPYGLCERIDDPEFEGSCTQTYTKICDREKFAGGACNRSIGNEDVYRWYCDPS